METVSDEKLAKYFSVTKKALAVAKAAPIADEEKAKLIFDMVKNYVSDAEHFQQQGNKVLAFAALNYAHGWIDAGASLEVYEVHDSTLFTVD